MQDVLNRLIIELFFKNPIFWIIVILAIISFFFWKKIVGKVGEYWVKSELKKLDKREYLAINDVTLKSNKFTHQIDHIVISKYGIFVIETKQYNGYIMGNETDKKWIQNKKYYINNPIHQNYGHVKCLEQLLNLDNNYFIPIVCISGRAKLKIKAHNHVVKLYDLNKVIMSYKNEIISNYNQIYNHLLALNIKDKKILKEHISNAKQTKKEKEYNKNSDICPLCGGNLLAREGKYGKFIGCSNYPKCKFTKKYK